MPHLERPLGSPIVILHTVCIFEQLEAGSSQVAFGVVLLRAQYLLLR